MPASDDEKYEKAARQSRRDFCGILGIVVLVVVLCLLGSSFSSRSLLSNNPTAVRRVTTPNEPQLEKPPPLPHQEEEEEESLEDLTQRVQRLDQKVRDIKAKVDIFETDPTAQTAAKALQEATRQLLHRKFGTAEPYRVVVTLEFQETIPDFAQRGKDGRFVIEMAPTSLQPHSVYTFLQIAQQWNSRKRTGSGGGGNGGAFHRIAHHVLQVMVRNPQMSHLAFQEYSPEYPHAKRTVGYAGRPSGPAWYVSIQDNTQNHGPGSQQQHNPYEADSCFGKVIDGFDESVLRITRVPGTGFLGDPKKHVLITDLQIQIPTASGSHHYQNWVDRTTPLRT